MTQLTHPGVGTSAHILVQAHRKRLVKEQRVRAAVQRLVHLARAGQPEDNVKLGADKALLEQYRWEVEQDPAKYLVYLLGNREAMREWMRAKLAELDAEDEANGRRGYTDP